MSHSTVFHARILTLSQLLHLLKLGHRNFVAEMPLKQPVRNQTFGRIALRINK
jgi:hypothetical protein